MLLHILSNDVPQTMCNLKFMKTYIINLFTHLNNSIQSELLYYIYTQLQKAHYSYSSHIIQLLLSHVESKTYI